jgi:hypothetical protein
MRYQMSEPWNQVAIQMKAQGVHISIIASSIAKLYFVDAKVVEAFVSTYEPQVAKTVIPKQKEKSTTVILKELKVMLDEIYAIPPGRGIIINAMVRLVSDVKGIDKKLYEKHIKTLKEMI